MTARPHSHKPQIRWNKPSLGRLSFESAQIGRGTGATQRHHSTALYLLRTVPVPAGPLPLWHRPRQSGHVY
jgi:hypothetical protein